MCRGVSGWARDFSTSAFFCSLCPPPLFLPLTPLSSPPLSHLCSSLSVAKSWRRIDSAPKSASAFVLQPISVRQDLESNHFHLPDPSLLNTPSLLSCVVLNLHLPLRRSPFQRESKVLPCVTPEARRVVIGKLMREGDVIFFQCRSLLLEVFTSRTNDVLP